MSCNNFPVIEKGACDKQQFVVSQCRRLFQATVKWLEYIPIKIVARTEIKVALDTTTSINAFNMPASRKQYNNMDVCISAMFDTRFARLGRIFLPSMATKPSLRRHESW